MTERNEAHITNVPNGHALSIDCWCEPNKIYWSQNSHGVKILVCEHNDFTLTHHNVILTLRESGMGHPAEGTLGIDDPWITRVLESLFKPPLMLPPHEGDPA